jgi:hypothetical protein
MENITHTAKQMVKAKVLEARTEICLYVWEGTIVSYLIFVIKKLSKNLAHGQILCTDSVQEVDLDQPIDRFFVLGWTKQLKGGSYVYPGAKRCKWSDPAWQSDHPEYLLKH